MMIRAAFLIALAACSGSCGSPDTPASPTTGVPADVRAEAPLFQLARPSVDMRADPPPPFTYWAPEGAVIRNHGHPGVWVAYVDGVSVATYFGDECQASELQRYVGEPLSTVPAPSAVGEMRTTCSTCPVTDDLRRNRVNVIFDEDTQRVVSIGCY